MEKFKKFFKSAVLTLSMCTFILVSLPTAHADVGSFLLSQALGIIQGASSDTAQINAAKFTLLHSWSDNTYSSTSHLTKISGDDLTSIVSSLSSNGCPCQIVYTTSVGGTGVSGYWIVCTGEPFFVNRSAYSRIDSDHTYTGKHLGLFNYSSSYNSEFYFYSEHMPSTYYLKNIYDRIDSIWNWGQSGGLLTNINTACTLISNALTTANSWLGNIAGYVDSVESFLSSQSTKLSDIVTNTSNTVVSLRYTDSNGATNTAASLLYAIRTAANSIDTKFTTANSHLSNIANRTLNTANRLQTTVSGSTFTAAELLYSIANTNNSININLNSVTGYVDGVEGLLSSLGGYVDGVESSLSNIYSALYGQQDSSGAGRSVGVSAQQIATSLSIFASNVDSHFQSVEGYVDGLESALTTSNNLLQNIANRTLNTVSRLTDTNSKLDTIIDKMDDINTDFDSQGIIDSIDRIYDWLDNADLATNSTIISISENYTDELNSGILHSNRILDLFDYSYTDIDEGFTLSDWQDAKDFFGQFKEE